MKTKTTDLIASFFKSKGIKQVFGVTGGAAVHFFDSYIKKNYNVIFTHHEQSAAFAVCSYYKEHKKISICTTTTGPGCTNTITGLAAAWQDSIPCIFVVGQARSSQLSIKTNTRQVGTQEINSLSIVKSITKHSIILSENHNINQELQNAYEIALEGRPGPVWIEVPLDLQLKKVTSFQYKKKSILQKNNNLKTTNIKILKLKKLLLDSKKTVVIAGNGIITSDNVNKFKSFINKFNLPYVCTWLGVNLANVVPKNYCGRIGISGQRGANILIQNAELIIILGSHLCLPQTGVNTKAFAPKAKKILVNIDKNEYKASKIKFDEFLNIDLKIFFEKINKIRHSKIQSFKSDTINKIKQLNQIDKIHTEEKKKINQYYFIHRLNKLSIGNENYVIDGGGTNVYISYQALELKKKQKIIHTASICAMGSGLPESIGASSSMKKVICLIGDGSLMFNLQELQTIKTNKLPVKIITFNNNGYVSIRDTQRDFLNSKFYGSSATGGIEITNIKKIAKTFNFYYDFVSEKKSIDIKIKNFLNHKDACLLEVIVDPNQPIAPKQKFIKSKKGIGTPSGLDNMFPYLDYKSFLNF
jgi:acetolactate synthase I/II/III large subunit